MFLLPAGLGYVGDKINQDIGHATLTQEQFVPRLGPVRCHEPDAVPRRPCRVGSLVYPQISFTPGPGYIGLDISFTHVEGLKNFEHHGNKVYSYIL